MDTFRWMLGLALVVGMPPAVGAWFVVHPVAGWWRRAGVGLTYTALGMFMIASWVLLIMFRNTLLGRDLGTNWLLAGPGIILYVASAALEVRCRRHLSMKTFMGVPEVSSAGHPGRLLQEGIYGRVRHPRYLGVLIGTTGAALVANHLGVYVVVGLCLVGLWPLIVLEERELLDRFGPAYEDYRSRVPALLPAWRPTRPARP